MDFNMISWQSFKTRMTLFTLAIFLMGIWSLEFYTSKMLRKDMQHMLADQQFATVSLLAAQVNEELENRLQSLKSTSEQMSSYIMDNPAALQTFLELRPVLQGLFNYGTFITGIDGTVIATFPASIERIGINFMERDCISKAIKEGKASIDKPVLGKRTQNPVINIAVPIRDSEDKVMGALVGSIDLNKPNFMDKITDNRYGKTGGYFLVAPQYRLIVTASDKSRVMQQFPAPGVVPAIDRFLQGHEESSVYVNPLGIEVLGSIKNIPVAGWFLGAILPTEEAFAPVRAMQQRMLIIASLLTILAGGLTWWMTLKMLRRHLSPMLTATELLTSISDTNQFPQPLPITSTDEIGDLVRAFNYLIENLKQREAVLTETKELFAIFVKNSPIYTYIKEITPTASRVLQASDNFEEMIGIPGSQMNGKMMTELFPAEFAAKITADDQAVVSRGEVLKIDEELNGRSYTTIKFPLVQGDQILLAGYTIDITERKQAQEALVQSEQRRSLALEAAKVGTWEWDLQTNENIWSNELWLLYGLEPYSCNPSYEEWRKIVHPDDRSETEHILQDAVLHGIAYDTEWRLNLPDGTERWLLSRGRPIKDIHGGIVRYLGIVMDITEHKRYEAEKKELQAQLIQTQKMEAIGQLAGGVAHDFNNKLGVIQGHAELAMDLLDPAKPLYRDLSEIHKAAKRSADITRQLLAFARKQTITPKVIDLNETVEGMLKMLRRLIGEDIDLVWMPGSGLWKVKVDPSQIDQILANLCINARAAIAGVGKITVMTENCTLDEYYSTTHTDCIPGEYVRITVSDNGCGMDKITLAHIFEPFFTTKGVGEGTGLGLATVFGAVKQNNGIINVYSEPGQGTSFMIHLPRNPGNTQQGRIALETEPAHGHETILLVEDESTILGMTVRMLEHLGYTVLAASSPEEAMRLIAEFAGEVHVLMTDVVMPGMNGRDLADRLLKDYPAMKCLFMSGYTGDIITNQGVLNEGMNFIQKPFSMKELATQVRQVLENKDS